MTTKFTDALEALDRIAACWLFDGQQQEVVDDFRKVKAALMQAAKPVEDGEEEKEQKRVGFNVLKLGWIADKTGLHSPQFYEIKEKAAQKPCDCGELEKALESIRSYDTGSGCCVYGCDTPSIAAQALNKHRKKGGVE